VPVEDTAAQLTQVIYEAGELEKTAALARILGHHRPDSAVIFCNHRETCDVVADALSLSGFAAVALHGGMDQHDRNTVLLLLGNGSLRVLVATDVAARGLDIDELGAVINCDLPREPDVFVHRIGRTARAGHHGLAITLVGPQDRRAFDELRQGPLANVPLSPLPATGTESTRPPPPSMITIAIQGGRHDRLRPGDIVGALTADIGLAATDIGQIKVMDRISFVALAAAVGPRALEGLAHGRGIKKKRFRAYQVSAPVPGRGR
jgi:ATP-independent RNA helicase DbpA